MSFPVRDPIRALALLLVVLTFSGCERRKQATPEKSPRPVKVATLTADNYPESTMISASVGSWKTEQLGFEVSGRVAMVVEPNTEIEGRVFDKQGNLITGGTRVAQLDTERYELALEQARADVERAGEDLEIAWLEFSRTIPAEVDAAVARLDLATAEVERSGSLFSERAGPEADVERDRANLLNAEAELDRLIGSWQVKLSQIFSLEETLKQTKQAFREAERNLEDCTLYSSFRGQIANISVVPGSVVEAGTPVANIQMMDPIQVEFEVSAEQSRELRRSEVLQLQVAVPDADPIRLDGYLYLIDSVADPRTRTFTTTLLVENQKVNSLDELPAGAATTADVWRLNYDFLPGAGDGMLAVEEGALLEDEQGAFLWMITNLTADQRTGRERELKVRKLRVQPADRKMPFLGNWVFQQIAVEDAEFDPDQSLVIGKLSVGKEPAGNWDGDTVYLKEPVQWQLRPGDVVRVDLAGREERGGIYVPMNAIARDQGDSYLFLVEEQEGQTVARRVAIRRVTENAATGAEPTSELQRIEAVDVVDLVGRTYVTEGVHYLIDGEPINIVGGNGASQ